MSLIVSVIEIVNDMQVDDSAHVANEWKDKIPEREEILKAMKEINDSTPGGDGVRLGYIHKAYDEVPERDKIVRMRFDKRENGIVQRGWQKTVLIILKAILFFNTRETVCEEVAVGVGWSVKSPPDSFPRTVPPRTIPPSGQFPPGQSPPRKKNRPGHFTPGQFPHIS